MRSLSIIALFCEDIRDEVSGQITLVGLMQDNVNVSPPGSEVSAPEIKPVGEMCLYIRTNFDPDDKIPEIAFRLIMPDDATIDVGYADAEVIATAKRHAKEKGNPLAGLISRALLMPFHLSKPGVVTVEAVIGDEVRTIGNLNFLVAKEATSSTAH